MIYLRLPGLPPSSNNAYFNLPRGGRALTKEGKNYLTTTKTELSRTYREELQGLRPNEPYHVFFRFTFLSLQNLTWPKSAKTRYQRLDVSNRIKLLEDALKEAGGIDDSQNMVVLTAKQLGPEERTEIWIWSPDREPTPFAPFFHL